MQRILAEHVPGIEVLGIGDVEGYVEPVEDEPTFAGNALLKARAGVAATGLPSVADDSGLCVDALNGIGIGLCLNDMPGLAELRESAGRLEVEYAELPDGAQISYTTDDSSLGWSPCMPPRVPAKPLAAISASVSVYETVTVCPATGRKPPSSSS